MTISSPVRGICAFALAALFSIGLAAAQNTGSAELQIPSPTAPHRNFKVAVYIPAPVVERMRDRAWLEQSWQQISSHVKVDKVYIETYRSHVLVDGALVESVKRFFQSQGVEVAGGIAFTDGRPGNSISFSYTDPANRAYIRKISAFTARHFNEIILDDFFFTNTKTPGDIAAKGRKSWTAFRLGLMDQAARELVVGPAHAANPQVHVIIKFPTYYPYFQSLGFDLSEEPRIFDGIYTGTETREPAITMPQLQQYESYEVLRYFDNVAPGRNGGGWVDPYYIRYIDRYAEQLWDTLLAKPPQIMLFEWQSLLRPAEAGDRPWSGMNPSFDYAAWFGQAAAAGHPPNFAAVAGRALAEMDPLLGELGTPVGLASYNPYELSGEPFLQNYLGMIGIPIEMTPEFPRNAPIVLLTETAQSDPGIVRKIKQQLMAGKDVVITSGLLHALENRGIQDICEARVTSRKLMVDQYWGADTRTDLSGSHPASILFPEILFPTNDAWPVMPVVRGIANGHGESLLLMDRYGRGTFYVLTVPDNANDLYRLPEPVLNALRSILASHLGVQLQAPSKISLFLYDNKTFVAESFRDTPTLVTFNVQGSGKRLRNILTGKTLTGTAAAPADGRYSGITVPRTAFHATVPPHSYVAFAIE